MSERATAPGPDAEWVVIASYESAPGGPRPPAALRARLRDRGIDRMPFAGELSRCDLACGTGPDGCRRRGYTVRAAADALPALGPHPDQPASVTGTSSPRCRPAAAERNAERCPRG
ncbi:hypothetical protein AB0E21_17930 [Streptomyces sp. NPDC047967]|uniref:hypothetical protein n=1 Tax=unclassified Streptomyces TaxID=2593676 RepID=UPI00209B95C6|nr:hypothetical protein [Streptomyces sp. YPW6]